MKRGDNKKAVLEAMSSTELPKFVKILNKLIDELNQMALEALD